MVSSTTCALSTHNNMELFNEYPCMWDGSYGIEIANMKLLDKETSADERIVIILRLKDI